MALVSIIIPVYQVEKYIADTIESVCKQEYQDIEIVLVDNNTKDDSINIAKQILCQYNKRYIVVEQPKQGLAATRNMGFDKAAGDWVVSIDSDDTISPVFVKELVSFAMANQLDVVTGRYKYVNSDELFSFDVSHNANVGKIFTQDEVSSLYITRQLPIMITNTLFNKKFLTKSDLILDEEMMFGADLAFMWKVIAKCKSYGYVDQVMYNYYNRPDSLMTAPSMKKIESRLNGFARLVCFLRNCDFKYTDIIYDRELFGLLATISQFGNLSMVKEVAEKFYHKETYERMKLFPDRKIRFANFLLSHSVFLYHRLNSIVRNSSIISGLLTKKRWNI